MIVTTSTGHGLPWGQMSFRGATVIINLASAIPVVGDTIVTWLWGGFPKDNATLNHFFSPHHPLPFIPLIDFAIRVIAHKFYQSSRLNNVPYIAVDVGYNIIKKDYTYDLAKLHLQ